jgi:CDP-4-dehydro-6-deoxyglucose reductase
MNQILIKWPGGSGSFSLSESGSILDQALISGIKVNHACKRGDCGQCFAKIIESADSTHQPGNMQALCLTKAEYSGVFEFPAEPIAYSEKSQLVSTKIRSSKLVAHRIYQLRLYLPPKTRFEFKGGQFATLIVNTDLERNYSIAEYHSDALEIEFYIKQVQGGRFGDWLANAVPGTLLRVRAPLGAFKVGYKNVRASHFIATGTGIVSIYSLLKSATEEQLALSGRIRIIWGNRTPDELFLVDELRTLSRRINAEIEFVFSCSGTVDKRYVTDHLKGIDFQDMALYAAGHPAMVKDARAIAFNQSIDPLNFHSDAFAFSASKEDQL